MHTHTHTPSKFALPWWLIGKGSACQCGRCGLETLGQEDPLEKEMAAHSSILAWETLWTVESGGPQSVGLQRGRYNLATKTNKQTK